MHTHTRAFAAALLVTLSAGASGAQQQTTGPRFQGWIGCWSGAPASEARLRLPEVGLICITPTADANVVVVSTIVDGKVASTKKIDASGREQAIDATGCTGVQSAAWSADERRIYLKAAAQCGGMTRTSSGILAMTPLGEWLDIQSVTADGTPNLRVVRYHDAGVPSTVPAEIASALSGRTMATQSARIASGADIGRTAVVEASRIAAPSVVEAWILERGQPFAIDGKELVSLADAGISPLVTDAIVAVSNPTVFAIGHQESRMTPFNDTTVVGQRTHIYIDPRFDPYGWGYRPYGYSPYGYYDYRFGSYNNYYGGGYGGGYGYGAPVIIVNGSADAAHGRRVKGEGYVPPGGSTAAQRSASERSRSAEPSSSPSSSSSSSSSSSESSKQSDSGSGRTAHQKP